jgi:antitoxin component of MazEF toxin-antitoxin module
MNTQTIFKVGNSNAVAIPSHLMKELGFKHGQKVVVERLPDTDGIIIVPEEKKPSKKKLATEFKRWLDTFLQEDGALLDELADR